MLTKNRPRRLYAVQIDIFEAAGYPIVRHVMFGKTKREAWHYVNSHMKTDSFFAGCIKKNRFSDIDCTARFNEGWVPATGC